MYFIPLFSSLTCKRDRPIAPQSRDAPARGAQPEPLAVRGRARQIVVDVEDICEDELTPARQLGGRVRAQGGGGLHVRAGARRA